MNLYKEFCNETFDSSGVLTDFDLCYKENFNFGYDVVDRIAMTRTTYMDKPVQDQRMVSVTADEQGVSYPEPEKC